MWNLRVNETREYSKQIIMNTTEEVCERKKNTENKGNSNVKKGRIRGPITEK